MKDALISALPMAKKLSCFCGFDGFIDEVVHTVDIRFDAEHYSRVMTLEEYGQRISSASGLSLNVEIVSVDKKLGGNGPIFANGLKCFGAEVTYIGSVGSGAIDPVFSSLAEGSTIIGIADPGQTDAMEFSDGKIIRSKLASLCDVTWEAVKQKAGLDGFVDYLDSADLISFNNWTMLPHMSVLWDGILHEAIPRMKKLNKHDKVMFFDLADPEKRTAEDIRGALARIQSFRRLGFNTVLGLNKKEACEISGVLGREVAEFRTEALETLTRFLFDSLELDCLVVHPVDCAACMSAEGYSEVLGPYCAAPLLTTGAGDNFNTGFVFGYLQGYAPDQCLCLGTATSGYYVRACHSPKREELIAFLSDWRDGNLT